MKGEDAPAECSAAEPQASFELLSALGPVKVTVACERGTGAIVVRLAAGWVAAQMPVAAAVPAAERVGGGYVFRRRGKHWEVVFGGGRPFRVRNTLGARYLNYLLHQPNVVIHAFDLEVAVQPEKGEARSRNSVLLKSDDQAEREYRRALGGLKAEREAAQAAGQREAVERLDGQIEALESALKGGEGSADTGERARDNVRKAIGVVTEQLAEGGPEEKAFAEHLRIHLSIGYECLYNQPGGRIWD